MQKYLIVGGAGFIGSHLSSALADAGHKVVVIDNSSAQTPSKNNPNIITYQNNIEDTDKISEIFTKEKPDAVYHLAGAINLRNDIASPQFKKDTNILERTEKLLQVCIDNNVKKFIFISSGGAIYENAKQIPTKETYLAHPGSLYGLANLMIETYLQLLTKKNDMQITIIRLSNVYGPGQWQSGLIPSLVTKILNRESPIIYGNGKQTRDFIYIDDVVRILMLVAEQGKGGIYNVGSSKEVSLNTIFKMIKKILSSNIAAIYKEVPEPGTKRSALDIRKAKKEFGWQPEIDIKEGIQKTIEFYAKAKK